jgi:predicted anti-sigma-YlaC factor YlaD
MNAPTKKDALAAVALANIDYGVTITVPASNVALYAGLKTGELAVLTRLISDEAGGCQLELTKTDVQTLIGLTSELAHLAKGLVAAIAYSGAGVKGGV